MVEYTLFPSQRERLGTRHKTTHFTARQTIFDVMHTSVSVSDEVEVSCAMVD